MTWLARSAGMLLGMVLMAGTNAASAQPLDLSQGGPITITARDGLEWHQTQQEVIALGDARAVRQNVTVTADRLIAFYRKKAQPDGSSAATATQVGTATQAGAHGQAGTAQPVTVAAHPAAATQTGTTQTGLAADADTAGTEVYRLRAEGNVQIFTATDHAQGDVAVYDIDQAVLVMTGHNLKLTTPNDILTARDTMEYWPQKHMAVARGNAVAVTRDARQIAADVLVGYTSPAAGQGAAGGPTTGSTPRTSRTPARTTSPGTPTGSPATSGDDLASSGKLEKVEAFGHVSVRTPTDTAIGERAVYVPDSGIARLAGNVRITRGQNQLDGQEAEVNMNTGIARLLRGSKERVTGLVVPNDATNRDLPDVTKQPTSTANPTGTNSTTNPTGATKPTGGHP
jgi:lipopolysaccharide export system protein LptA